jgi:hypothetical protein
MKKFTLFITALIYLGLVSFTIFEKKIGSGSCYEEGYSVIPLETGYLISGNYNCQGGASNCKSFLVFLDESGDTVWSRRDLYVNGFAKKTSDNNLIFIGGNYAGLVYDSIRISKADQMGNLLWSKSFLFSQCKNSVTDIHETADGFIVTGFFSVTGCNNPSFESFVMKLDLSGNQVWTKIFTGTHNEQFHSVKEISKGIIVAFGWSNSFSVNNKADYLMVVFDEFGNIMDTKLFGDDNDNFGYGLEVLQDGSFILNGYSDVMEVMHVNNDFSLDWTKTYQQACGSSYFKVKKTSDNGLALVGTEEINGTCTSVFYKMKINGDVVWKKSMNGLVRDFTETSDGMFVLTGFADYLPNMYVVKFDSSRIRISPYATAFDEHKDVDVDLLLRDLGISTQVDESSLEEKFPSVKIFPNPAIHSMTMKFSNPDRKPFRLEIFDSKGSMVYMQTDIRTSEIIFFRGTLSLGMYTYKLSGNGNIYCGKMMFN